MSGIRFVYVLYTSDIRFVYVNLDVYTVYKTYAYDILDIFERSSHKLVKMSSIRIVYGSYTSHIRLESVYETYTKRMRTGSWTFLVWTHRHKTSEFKTVFHPTLDSQKR
jgi:hypothetical protein